MKIKYIKLTRKDGEKFIWLERSKIESVEAINLEYQHKDCHTTITTTSKDMFEVKETPQEIFYKMNTFADDCDIYEN